MLWNETRRDRNEEEKKHPVPQHTNVYSPSTSYRGPLHEFRKHPLFYTAKCATELSSLHALKLTPRIVIVDVSILNFLGQLPLPLPGLLSILKFKSVLIHREPHSLNAIVM